MFDFTRLPDATLENELCEQAAHLAAGECRLLLLVAEFDRRGTWAGQGFQSCAHWLSWRVGTGLGVAREHVRVGRALEDLPLTRQAFATAEISFSKVRAITRVATPDSESHFLDLARVTSASQLESIVRGYRRAEEQGPDGKKRPPRTYLHHYSDDDGMVVITARLTPDGAAVVFAAMDAARAALAGAADTDGGDVVPAGGATGGATGGAGGESDLDDDAPWVPASPHDDEDDAAAGTSRHAGHAGHAGHADTSESGVDPVDTLVEDGHDVSAETSDHGQRKVVDYDERAANDAEALVTACASVLANAIDQDGHAPAVVFVHIDEPVLRDPDAPGCSYVSGVGGISGHVARRIACDAAVANVVYRADGSVEPEAATRRIPARMRRAVIARDRGCRFPGCSNRLHLHAHHVVFWSEGGKTTPSNLVMLCSRHHRLVHEGGWRLELAPRGALRVWMPDGTELPAVAPARRAHQGNLRRANRQRGLRIGPDTPSRGEGHMDRAYVVGCLIDALHPPSPPPAEP